MIRHLNTTETKHMPTTKQPGKGFVHKPDIHGKDGSGSHMTQSNTWLGCTSVADTTGFQQGIVVQEERKIVQGRAGVTVRSRKSIECWRR